MPTKGDIYYFESKGGTTTKPPVVFLHGAGGTFLNWPHTIRRIPEYRIYAPDLPGHGKSTGRGKQTIREYVNDIIDWLHNIGIYRAVFIGHSMGGAIALTLALEYPDQVLGLGLVGSGARLKVRPDLLEILSLPRTYQAGLNLVVKLAYVKEISASARRQIDKQLSTMRQTVVHGDYVACDGFDVMEQIGNIAAPTLVLCGELDQMTPLKYSEYLTEHIPKILGYNLSFY